MQPWLWVGPFALPTYSAAAAVAVALATVVVRREALRGGLPPRAVLDAVAVGLLCAAIGARVFHLAVEIPGRVLADPAVILDPRTGWTFYGGLIGGLLGVGAWARRGGLPLWDTLDAVAVAIPFTQAIARLGCLGAGCCHGRVADWPLGVEVPWAIAIDRHGVLPDELLAVPLHPAPLYLSLMNVALFAGLSWLRARQRFPGQVLAALLVGYGAGRAGVDAFRGDAARGLFLGGAVSTAQLVGAVAVVAGLILWRRRSRCTPSS